MKSGFDVPRIQEDGYLILPLSMSRLATGQNPEFCYGILGQFLKKIESYSNDVVFLYTNGLYFNSMDISFENRKKTNQQVLNHCLKLKKMIETKKEFIPGAIHYLPVDYVILNSPYFHEYFAILKKQEGEDEEFRDALKKDSGDREYNEANVNFLLEEITIAHILRQHLVELPRTLVKKDVWRLIGYPGLFLYSDLYQWKMGLLPKTDKVNPYAGAQYDLSENKIYLFDEIPL